MTKMTTMQETEFDDADLKDIEKQKEAMRQIIEEQQRKKTVYWIIAGILIFISLCITFKVQNDSLNQYNQEMRRIYPQ